MYEGGTFSMFKIKECINLLQYHYTFEDKTYKYNLIHDEYIIVI